MDRKQVLSLGVLASGGGSNMQAIIDRGAEGSLDARVSVVISNNSGSGALARARRHGIPAVHASRLTHPDPHDLDSAIANTFRRHEADWVVLAGYMRQLGPVVLDAFRGRILNIHPALLPKFGGKGMYGMHVHTAVLAAGETESGATVHLVTEDYDAGPPLARKRVPVLPGDTPEVLQKRVLAVEHEVYADAIQALADGRLVVEGGLPSVVIE